MAVSYRLFRSSLRAGIEVYGRPVRLLGWDRVPDGAAIFKVHRPPRLLEAMMLVAVCDRPIRCLLPQDLLHGLGRILSRGAGVVAYRDDEAGRHNALRACSEALAAGEILAVFAGAEGTPMHAADAALGVAQDAWAAVFPEHGPVRLSVHSFWPMGRKDEILIHIGDPLSSDRDRASLREADEEIASEVTSAGSVFALDRDNFEHLLENVEEALRKRLATEWAGRRDSKQTTDGFRLSAPAAEQLRRLNLTRPEELVALRRQFDSCREVWRQWSLARLRAERGRKQFSGVQRLLIWIETVLGLPVALWGALNHAAIGLLLYLLGLTVRVWQPQAGRWAARALVVFGCYAGQIAIVGHVMGRAAAGYYAVTLPVSGAYLWRYAWLLRRRARVLLLGARAKTLQQLAENRWKLLLAKLDTMLTLPVRIAPATPRI